MAINFNNGKEIKDFLDTLGSYSTIENLDNELMAHLTSSKISKKILGNQANVTQNLDGPINLRTKRIVRLITSNQAEDKELVKDLKEETVVNAMQGLGVLLGHLGLQEGQWIEKAFKDLMEVQKELKKQELSQKKEKNFTLKSLFQRHSLESSKSISKPADRTGYFSKITHFVSEKIKKNFIDEGNFSLVKPLFVKESKQTDQAQGAIQSLLQDPDLRKTDSLSLNQNLNPIEISSTFITDIHRYPLFRLNGEILFSNQIKDKKNVKDDISLTVLDLLKVLVRDQVNEQQSEDFLIKEVIKAFNKDNHKIHPTINGLKNSLEQVVLLLTQATLFDLMQEQLLKLHKLESIKDLHSNGEDLYFDVNINPDTISIKVLMLFRIEVARVSNDSDQKGLLIGYTAVQREINLPREELSQNLLEKKEGKTTTNLEVTDSYSELFLKKEAAIDSLDRTILKDLKSLKAK